MRRIYLSAFILHSSFLGATTLTWNSTLTSSMNTSTNWSPALVPVNGDDLIFPASGSLIKAVLNDIPSASFATLGNLTISDTYTWTGGGFTVPAGTLALTYGATGSLINVGPITLTGTWQIGGAGASPGNEIRSSMSGVGSLDILGSFLVLSGVNTYSGATILGTGATLKASGRVRFLPLPASRSQAEPYWI